MRKRRFYYYNGNGIGMSVMTVNYSRKRERVASARVDILAVRIELVYLNVNEGAIQIAAIVAHVNVVNAD